MNYHVDRFALGLSSLAQAPLFVYSCHGLRLSCHNSLKKWHVEDTKGQLTAQPPWMLTLRLLYRGSCLVRTVKTMLSENLFKVKGEGKA